MLDPGGNLYLDLMERALAGELDPEGPWERWFANLRQRLRHPYATRYGTLAWPLRAHTMIGTAALRNLRDLVGRTIAAGTPGDFIETGVWRGGACIMMRAVLAAHAITDRRVFCADSFAGLPRPDAARYPVDRQDRLAVFRELAIPLATVKANFATYGLLDQQVVFVPGLFKNTLPDLRQNRFALIRLDGDMYESTMNALGNLYDSLSPGGFVVIDDYGRAGCRRAVTDFLADRNATPQLEPLPGGKVWWQKA